MNNFFKFCINLHLIFSQAGCIVNLSDGYSSPPASILTHLFKKCKYAPAKTGDDVSEEFSL